MKINNDMFSISDKILNQKWMMEKKSYHTLWSVIHNLNDVRVGGLRGMIFGDTPLVKMQLSPENAPFKQDDEGDISIINISGVLTKGAGKMESELLGLQDTDDISNELDKAAEDPSVNSIILCFNSPGGETCGIAELGRKIKRIDTEIKPVYAWTETHMASAASWLGSQTRLIGMTETAQIGSCGVYMLVLDASEKYKNEGINVQAISSGKWKMMGHDIAPLKQEEIDLLNADVEKQHQSFKDIVKANRPDIQAEALEGLSYEGPAAIENGWADIMCDNFAEFIGAITMNNNK